MSATSASTATPASESEFRLPSATTRSAISSARTVRSRTPSGISVACFVASDPSTSGDRVERKTAEAAELFELSRRLARTRRAPRLIAVGGLPATGKSSVTGTLRQLLFGKVDLALHQRYGLPGSNDAFTPFEIERQIDVIADGGEVADDDED